MRVALRLAAVVTAAAAGALVALQPVLATPAPDSWALARVQAAPTEGLAPVVVAVVDSGVDGRHPALAGRVLRGVDLVDGGRGDVDLLGHGTEVAGILAAGSGPRVGIAPNAVVLPVRVLDGQGRGTVARLAEAIRWSVDHGAQVVNLSVETGGGAATLCPAVEYAWTHGVVVVAIAGNGGGRVQRPASCRHSVAVGATDERDAAAAFSASGRTLDLVAPGVRVPTTTPGGGYGEVDGTSAAAPLVAGAVALLLGREPEITNTAAVERLLAGAQDLGAPGRDRVFGAGLLNVSAALAA